MTDPHRSLLIVDDHAIVREGLRRVLRAISATWTVDEAASAHEALDRLREREYELVFVDLSMPGMSGLELLRRIRLQHPATAVLVLSMHAEQQYALRAFKAGASGYLAKDAATQELAAAVRRILAGGTYMSADVADRMVRELAGRNDAPRHAGLSDRELEVLQRLVDGERATDIAAALHLSIKTISTHKTRIQEKLGIDSLAGLVHYGIANGLTRPAPAGDAGALAPAQAPAPVQARPPAPQDDPQSDLLPALPGAAPADEGLPQPFPSGTPC